MSWHNPDSLVHLTSGAWHGGVAPTPWTSAPRFSIDTRTLLLGEIFVALPGAQTHGAAFLHAARSRGASCAIVGTDWHDVASQSPAVHLAGTNQLPLLVVLDPQAALDACATAARQEWGGVPIGVTGSVGKTSTRELIYSLLSEQFVGFRSEKNHNNELGLPLSLLSLEPQHEFAVLEMGASKVGDIAKLAMLAQPEIGVITHLGEAHFESFGGYEGILQGKGELFDALPRSGFAVLPVDCPRTRELAARPRCNLITVGCATDADLQARSISKTASGWRFSVEGSSYELFVPGKHFMTGALCAIAIGREFGMQPSLMADGLAKFKSAPGRCDPRQIGPWHVLDDSYNASPASMAAALETLAISPQSGGPRIAILGDMLELGGIAQVRHRQIGQIAAELRLDGLIALGEWADEVVCGAIEAGMSPYRVACAREIEPLLAVLGCWLTGPGAVLVKGSRRIRMERVVKWLEESACELARPASA